MTPTSGPRSCPSPKKKASNGMRIVHRVEVTYRVSTPLFCAGASPDQPEIRLPSFKGALRYWWRALAWSQIVSQQQGSGSSATQLVLNQIKSAEDEWFGSSQTGQGRIRMQMQVTERGHLHRKGDVLKDSLHHDTVGEGVRYFGYGLLEAYSRKGAAEAGQTLRACLLPPIRFTVFLDILHVPFVREPASGVTPPPPTVVSKPLQPSHDLSLILRALQAIGLFGGLGARSRRGFGSLILEKLIVDGDAQWCPPQSLQELSDRIIQVLIGTRVSGYPPYTAFSDGSRVVLAEADSATALDLLDLLGREMIRFRSYGRRGKILGGIDSERNFQDDRDLMNNLRKGKSRNRYPRRAAFGLPHNYGKAEEDQVLPIHSDRRASPLFFHIHLCDGHPVAVLTFLPACFLPPCPHSGQPPTKISVGTFKVPLDPEDELFAPVAQFLDRMTDPSRRREAFSCVEEVRR